MLDQGSHHASQRTLYSYTRKQLISLYNVPSDQSIEQEATYIKAFI